MQKYKHPLSFNIAKTDYTYHPETRTICGSIEWMSKEEYVSEKFLYLVADDSCQFNKVLPPNGIGVTAFLEVIFLKPVLAVKKIALEVKIIDITKSTSGKNKTQIKGKIYDIDSAETYVEYEGLFIESSLIKTNNFQLGDKNGTPYKITRMGAEPNFSQSSNDSTFKNILEIKTALVSWKDGYGPADHVHGGIISFPIFDKLGELGISVKKIRFNYCKAIPLETQSEISVDEEKRTFKIMSGETTQTYGTYDLFHKSR